MVLLHTLEAVARVARQLSLGAAVFIIAGATAFAQDEAPEDYPAGAGRDDTFYACTACHGFKLVAQQGMNRRQWNESVDLMISKHGMPAPEAAERETILDYLETTFPPRTTPARGGFQNPFVQ
jgi:hypothetical protein